MLLAYIAIFLLAVVYGVPFIMLGIVLLMIRRLFIELSTSAYLRLRRLTSRLYPKLSGWMSH